MAALNGRLQVTISVLLVMVTVLTTLLVSAVLSDDDAKYVPRAEFEQVRHQLDRLEEKVDENAKQQRQDFRELMREIQKRNGHRGG